jgi:hypothetical protein
MALPALAFFGVFALLPLGGGGGAEPDALGRHRRPELGRFEPLTPGQNFRPATRLRRAAGREVVKRMAPRFAVCAEDFGDQMFSTHKRPVRVTLSVPPRDSRLTYSRTWR